MANWDESKHPRADDGKFGSGGGGSTGKSGSEGGSSWHERELAKREADLSAAQKAFDDAKAALIAGQKRGWSKAEDDKAFKAYDRAERKLRLAKRELQSIKGAPQISQKEQTRRDATTAFRGVSKQAASRRLASAIAQSYHPAANAFDIFYGDPIALNWSPVASEPSDAPIRVQLSPFGEFTLRDGGKRSGTVQHCSRAAFEAMVANWKATGARDILVDVDHASATGGSTAAAAWAKNLRVEDDGLCADFELTPNGRELVEGKCYRFVSPGWTLADDGTPIALCSVALTNRPNLPVKPVVNADDAGGRDPDDPNNGKKGNPEMDLKKIAAALGLPETATEDEVIAAIASMKDAQAQAAEEAANAKAEEFAANAVKAGKIAESSKDAVKAAYRSNPEVAEAMLNSLAAPAAPKQPLPDFGKAKQPQALNAAKPGADADPVAVYNAYVAMPDGTDKDAYLAANAQAISDGYEAVNKK